MTKKFVLTEETYNIDNRTLYRIKALRSFGDVKRGDLGGFIEREENLSHNGDCWIYNRACVFGYACVYNDARIYNHAHIYDRANVSGKAHIYDDANICGYARIEDDARIYGSAYVCGNAYISCNAHVYDKAHIGGKASIYGNAHIFGNAFIYESARVREHAHIYGKARVYGESFVEGNAYVFEQAKVCGDAVVRGNAHVHEHAKVQYSQLNTDLKEDLRASLRCQCNLISEGDKVIAYKVVSKDLSSLYDEDFFYKIGETVICENPREDNSSCSPGLHFSNPTYWDNNCDKLLDEVVYLKAEIELKDIITVQEGKIRCRKAKILSKIDIV